MIEARNGEAKIVAMTPAERCRYARKVLRVSAAELRGVTQSACKARMVLAWLIRADGSATIAEVASLLGCRSHYPIVKALARMVEWPGPATVERAWPEHHVARAAERHRRLTGDVPGVVDSQTEMVMRWMDACRRDPETKANAKIDDLVTELVPGGFVWKRAGKQGNRGNRKPRTAAKGGTDE